MSRPWMPLYVADYLADTRRLSTLEHGAYMLLIMDYWRNGSLPDDDRKLARIVGLALDEWMEIREAIADLFHEGWTHKRIDAELAAADEKANKAQAAAAKRWQSSSNADAYANAMQTHMPPHSERICLDDADGMLSQPQSHTLLDANASREKNTRERASFADEFEKQFWPVYPEKVGKAVALKAFNAARKRTELAPMLAGLRRYIETKPKDRPWCNPSTWLNQDRWLDQPAAMAGPNVLPFGSTDPPKPKLTVEQQAQIINQRRAEAAARGETW